MNDGGAAGAPEPEPPIPLTMLDPERDAVVSAICAGPGLARRLIAMGIKPGVTVSVSVPARGRVIVKVNQTRLAIGRGIAQKVLVRV